MRTFLQNKTAERLYDSLNLSEMPIIDYHCHLSPKEIYEDKEFGDIGQMWLQYDHYKWRLMRSFGVAEEYITGNKPYREKFMKFAECIGLSAGNPLYHWTAMELSQFFGIDRVLNKDTAEEIYQQANQYIKEYHLSPRKLIAKSKVEYIATTDDILDSLEYHSLLAQDKSFSTKVAPSFRTDKLALIQAKEYGLYIQRLSALVGFSVQDLDSLEKAICKRLDFFCEMGCRFSDIGIEGFPGIPLSRKETEQIWQRALVGEAISQSEYQSFLFYLYVFLAGEYQKRNMIMQLHLAVKRNANSKLFQDVGVDCGGDCVGDIVSGERLVGLLDTIHQKSGLPQTILYTLHTGMYTSMATVAQSFPNVRLGAAWWFQDHKRGIEEIIQLYAETAHLATFLGMLTDSRSFLSYSRHDYFRQILCNLIGSWIEKGEFVEDGNTKELITRICYDNIRGLIS